MRLPPSLLLTVPATLAACDAVLRMAFVIVIPARAVEDLEASLLP